MVRVWQFALVSMVRAWQFALVSMVRAWQFALVSMVRAWQFALVSGCVRGCLHSASGRAGQGWQSVSSWILTSRQPHRVTSGRMTHSRLFHTFSKHKSPSRMSVITVTTLTPPLSLSLSLSNLKQNEAHSARAESAHKGVNQRWKYVTQVQKRRPESPTVTLTWHACIIKHVSVHTYIVWALTTS